MNIIRKWGRSFLPLFLLISLVLSVGCGLKVVPKPDQTGEVDLESNIVTKEKDGVRISVQTMEWRYEPYYLDDFYTPFLVLIKNGTNNNLSVQYSDFVLIDGQGNQYGVVDPEKVERFFYSRPSPYPDTYFTRCYPPYRTTPFLAPSYPFGRDFCSDIALLALPVETILPGAQIRGFLFFRKVAAVETDLKLRVLLGEISEQFDFQIRR